MNRVARAIAQTLLSSCAQRIISVLSVLTLLTVGACVESHRAPQPQPDERECQIDQQKKICKELKELGATCECELWKNPRVTIGMGNRWRASQAGFSLLSQLERVDELSLDGKAVSPEALSWASSVSTLSVLHIQQAALTRQLAATLPRARNVFGFGLKEVVLDEHAWESVYQLNLLWLTVESCSTVLADIGPAEGQLCRLMSLRLSGPSVDDASLRRAGKLQSLRQVTIRHGNVTENGLQYINDLAHLTHLDLSTALVKDLTRLNSTSLRGLQELVLDDTLVADDSLTLLAAFRSLEVISLRNTTVSDHGIERLSTLDNLRFISLEGTQVTDLGLARLASHPRMITAVDARGDVILFQRSWLKTLSGERLPSWTAHYSKKLYLWTEKGRELLEFSANTVQAEE